MKSNQFSLLSVFIIFFITFIQVDPVVAEQELYIHWDTVEGASSYSIYKGTSEDEITELHRVVEAGEPTICAVEFDQLTEVTYFQVAAYDDLAEIEVTDVVEIDPGIGDVDIDTDDEVDTDDTDTDASDNDTEDDLKDTTDDIIDDGVDNRDDVITPVIADESAGGCFIGGLVK